MRGDRQAPPSAADDIARARDALAAIPPDIPRAEWVRVGQAAHAAGLAFDDFDTWSAGGATYDSRAVRDVWRSFHSNGGIGAGTLFFVAKTHGWHDDPAAPRPPPPTPAELARQQAEHEAKAAQDAAERRARAEAAAADGRQRLANGDRPGQQKNYLDNKGLTLPPDTDVRQEGTTLLVPMYTADDGRLRGLQDIPANGDKRFSRGTKVAGCLWWARPPAEGVAAPLIFVSEGVADALTVATATEAPTCTAFSAGNLLAVAQALRQRYPAADLVIAADADEAGQNAAAKAAAETGARVITPRFPAGASIDGKVPKDFDDLRRHAGIEAVRSQLMGLPDDADQATPAVPFDPPPVLAADLPPADSPADPPAHSAILDGTVIPDCGAGSGYMVRDRGVYYLPPENNKGESPPERWLCDRLDVLATTRDSTGAEWGRLVAWRNPAGQLRDLVIPAELLAGDGAEVRRELARGGLKMATGRGARELLAGYLMATTPRTQALSVSTTGWHHGAYVDRSRTVYGTAADGARLVLAAAQSAPPPAAAGTLADWRQSVAWLAGGNSRLVTSICAALAGPLLDLLGLEGGGLHLRGASSTGKSTALLAGASVVGNPADVMRSWRATAAGLEGVAAQHNDGTLFLDEIGEADPRQIGETAYMLANGRGRQRASAAGSARPVTTWRLLLVSSGELSLTAHMAAAGRRPAAGQELRLADIAADSGAGHGLFEQLHGHPTAPALADALRDAVAHQHGTAWPAWLDWLARHRADITDHARQMLGKFVAEAAAGTPYAQAGRLARRFGALAVAGELATLADITGWQCGEAERAARTCYATWLADYGDGPAEERALLDGVREFVEKHGASRFRDFTSASHVVHQLAGYYRIDEGRRVYLFHRTGLAEACRGADLRWAVRMLIARGWIRPGTDGRPTHHLRPDGVSDLRLYWLDPTAWADEN